MRRCAAVPLLALALAACGGSAKSSSSSAPPSSSTTSATTATTSSSGNSGGVGAPGTATALGTSTRPPEVPANQPTKTTSASGGGTAPAGGATNVHIRASFTILRSRLRPSQVTVPAFVAVGLTIASADGQSHQVVIRTPTAHTVTVPARARSTVRLPGTPAGTYAVTIDGKAAGSLDVGGEGGP